MIDLEYLASQFNALLGTDKFKVYLNTNAYPNDKKTTVTMKVSRLPFGFTTDELDAENMSVTLTFDLACGVQGDTVMYRDQTLAKIAETFLGRRQFIVEQPDDENYIVNTFFQQQPPDNPYRDCGGITQQIVLSGTVLVQNENCGALVGNDVAVYIDGVRLLKITRSSSLSIGADNNIPLSEETTRAVMTGISRVNTKTLNFLYTGKDIENTFLSIAEGAEFNVNKIYTYKVVYPSFILSVPFKLVGAALSDSSGTFLQYSLTVQSVSDASITEV